MAKSTNSIQRLALTLLMLSVTSACAPIRPSAVDSGGTISVHAVSMTTFVIDEHRYPTESAIYALSQLREHAQVSEIEFLIDNALLSHPVLPSDPYYDIFKGCSEIEKRVFLVAHDSLFGIPYPIYEFDPVSGRKGSETKCSRKNLTLEM